jgi:hypothetical protein
MPEKIDDWDAFCLRADEARVLYGTSKENSFSDPDTRVFGAIELSGFGSLSLDESERVHQMMSSKMRIGILEFADALSKQDDERMEEQIRFLDFLNFEWRFSPNIGAAILARELEESGFIPL